MKKISLLVSLMMVLALVGCGGTKAEEKVINVYTRDASSGTREAFFGFIGLGEDLTKSAIEVASNGDMASKVGIDANGIGYVSLDTDFSANKIVGLKYQGVEATKDNVINKSYTLARPFEYVTREKGTFESKDKEEMINALVDFMMNSKEGALALTAAGAIVTNNDTRVAWSTISAKYPVLTKDNSKMTILTGGSTSVEKAVKKVLETFQPYAGNVQFQMNQTGSSDGWKRVLGSDKDSANKADIGFASRAFKSEEDTTKAVSSGQFALDAVVAVISESNTSGITNITKDELNKVFSGTITKFSELSK